MRTEVKAGLIVGLIVICGVVFYAVNQGNSGKQVDRIPFAVKTPDTDKTSQSGTVRKTPVVTPAKSTDDLAARLREEARRKQQRDNQRVAARQSGPATTAPTKHTPTYTPTPGEQPVVKDSSTARPTTLPAVTTPAKPTPAVATPPRSSDTTRQDSLAARVHNAPKPKSQATKYTIERGDYLYTIAQDHYEDGMYWTYIRDANPGIDPDHLRIGQEIVLPPKQEVIAARERDSREQEKSRPSQVGRATYVVERGDTLIGIARDVLGNGSRWREIYELNKDKLANPDVLLPGTELHLPPLKSPSKPAPKP